MVNAITLNIRTLERLHLTLLIFVNFYAFGEASWYSNEIRERRIITKIMQEIT